MDLTRYKRIIVTDGGAVHLSGDGRGVLCGAGKGGTVRTTDVEATCQRCLAAADGTDADDTDEE